MRVLFLLRQAVMAGSLLAALTALAWSVGGIGGVALAEVRNPDGVAVIIGNRHYSYRDAPDVTFAHRDADAFRRFVIDVLGYDPVNIIDMRDATRGQLFDAFGTRTDPHGLLWAYLNPNGRSNVVVFFSGHGVSGLNDGRGYLLPVDVIPNEAEDDGLSIDLLYENLSNLEEAASIQVYLEASFSGSSAGGALIKDAIPVYLTPELPEGVGEKVVSLTAASGEQIASWDAEAEHGLFTHHLLDALYGGGDDDGDGLVTASEAKAYLDRHMTRAARRHHRRIQEASLLGSEGVVLAAAPTDGVVLARPDLVDPDPVPDPTEASVTTSKRQPKSAQEPSAPAPEPAETSPGVDRDQLIGQLVPFTGKTSRSVDLTVPFALNSADLTDAAREQLDELGAALAGETLRSYDVGVYGHTDASGPAEFNLTLSKARAAAVVDYLVEHFSFQTERFSHEGYGEERLLEDLEPNAPAHRRVEIVVFAPPPDESEEMDESDLFEHDEDESDGDNEDEDSGYQAIQ